MTNDDIPYLSLMILGLVSVIVGLSLSRCEPVLAKEQNYQSQRLDVAKQLQLEARYRAHKYLKEERP